MRKSPGAKYQAPGLPLTITTRRMTPAMAVTKPTRMRLRWRNLLARRPAASEDSRMPTVAAVKITPVWMAL